MFIKKHIFILEKRPGLTYFVPKEGTRVLPTRMPRTNMHPMNSSRSLVLIEPALTLHLLLLIIYVVFLLPIVALQFIVDIFC